jgi:hypothetical protein
MPIASMTTSIIGMLRTINFLWGNRCLMAEFGLDLHQEGAKPAFPAPLGVTLCIGIREGTQKKVIGIP